MAIVHNLGFPRIGVRRELKHALEAYWAGNLQRSELEHTGQQLRQRHWAWQAEAGVDLLPVGDFAWYDQILEWSCLLGAVPARFEQAPDAPVSLDTLFRMARGRAPSGKPAAACEMTKWFDSNYHYLVPELTPEMPFRIAGDSLFAQVDEATSAGHRVKTVIPGPLTWLWLGKGEAYRGSDDYRKLDLLNNLVPVYRQILERLHQQGVEWVQIDEPILALDLPQSWQAAFLRVYDQLSTVPIKLLLATYFGGLGDNLHTALALPVAGLHLDLRRAPDQLSKVLPRLRPDQVLSAGVIDGRNIWRTDLDPCSALLADAREQLGERLWLAPSCSLLHVPVDAGEETRLPGELQTWLSFARQKLEELDLLRASLESSQTEEVAERLAAQRTAIESRRRAAQQGNPLVRKRMDTLATLARDRRSPFAERIQLQQQSLGLPAFPTTTIGSFPQTRELRALRRDLNAGRIEQADYENAIGTEIARCIRFQEDAGLDVLVHGEPERNDMVEYFGEWLEGYAFTRFGWVQSYGSRCVKPPIIHADVHRPHAMTVRWSTYAADLTERPVKGMLTGPVTMLQWAFVRDDQPREITCRQIALALRDEVLDLEAAGIQVIQIDEPAFHEDHHCPRRHRLGDRPDLEDRVGLHWSFGLPDLLSTKITE